MTLRGFCVAPFALFLACTDYEPPDMSRFRTPRPPSGTTPSLSDPPVAPDPTSRGTPVPISGGTLALTSDGQVIVASDPNADAVWVVNRTSFALARVSLEPSAVPGRIAIENDQRAHVALRGSGAVATIDLPSKTLLRTTAVCPEPRGVAWDKAGGQLHVACAGGELVSFIPQANAALHKTQLEDDLRDVVVSSDGLWVSRFRGAELLKVRDGLIVSRVALPEITVLNGDARTTYAPAVAWRMVALEDGGLAVSHQGARVAPQVDLATISTTQGSASSSPYGGSAASCSAIVESFVTVFDSNAAVVGTGHLTGSLPVDIGATSNELIVATAGESSADHLFRSHMLSPPTSVSCFSNPSFGFGSILVPVAVAAHSASSLWVVQLERLDGMAVELHLSDNRGGIVLQLSAVRSFHPGRELFHASTRGNALACASCHPEATDDGRVWDFLPIGPRRTQALRGGIIGRAPFHWDGDLPTFESLMTEVFGRRMGASFRPGEAAGVAAWLDKVPALKTAPAGEAALRGREIFMSAQTQCASCHSGPLLTTNAKMDVGTGGIFKVPSLVGLGLRAPYLHDGCATTLEARFGDCGGGALHGNTGHLTPAQLSDLVAFLETL